MKKPAQAPMQAGVWPRWTICPSTCAPAAARSPSSPARAACCACPWPCRKKPKAHGSWKRLPARAAKAAKAEQAKAGLGIERPFTARCGRLGAALALQSLPGCKHGERVCDLPIQASSLRIGCENRFGKALRRCRHGTQALEELRAAAGRPACSSFISRSWLCRRSCAGIQSAVSRLLAPRVAQARDAVEHQIAAADGVLAPVGHEKAVALELVAVFGLGFGEGGFHPGARNAQALRVERG